MTRRPTPHVLLPVLILFLASCASVASPPAATLAALSGNGSYEVMTYTDFPDVPEFGDATIYYPQDAPAPVGGVAIAPGFTEVQSLGGSHKLNPQHSVGVVEYLPIFEGCIHAHRHKIFLIRGCRY